MLPFSHGLLGPWLTTIATGMPTLRRNKKRNSRHHITLPLPQQPAMKAHRMFVLVRVAARQPR